MNRFALTVVCCLLSIGGFMSARADEQLAGKAEVGAGEKVADGSAANVIVLDSAGGFRKPGPGGADDVVLSVKADGTASIRAKDGGKRQTWRMAPDAMNDLVRFFRDEQKFFKLKNRVGGGKPAAGPQAADPADWVLSVTADDKTHTVRGPMFGAGRAGQDLERFQRCITRLQGVMGVVAIGGGESANRFLKDANEVFTKAWPAEKPLTIADIASGTVMANGAVDVVFVRGTKTISAESPALDGPITCTIVNR